MDHARLRHLFRALVIVEGVAEQSRILSEALIAAVCYCRVWVIGSPSQIHATALDRGVLKDVVLRRLGRDEEVVCPNRCQDILLVSLACRASL